MPDIGPRDIIVEPLQMDALIYTHQRRLPMLVLYRPTTKDYPGKWAARLWMCIPKNEPTPFIFLEEDKEVLIAKIPGSMARLERSPEDDHTIEAVWL